MRPLRALWAQQLKVALSTMRFEAIVSFRLLVPLWSLRGVLVANRTATSG
jgi:hypothetical protein